MRILVVEDDSLELALVARSIERQLRVDVETISTESEFRERFSAIVSNPPDLIVMDVMLRWADPTPDLNMEEVPEDVRGKGFYTAGLRCLDMIRANKITADIPVILYTTLDQSDFKDHVIHTKSDDTRPLVDDIRRRLKLEQKSQ